MALCAGKKGEVHKPRQQKTFCAFIRPKGGLENGLYSYWKIKVKSVSLPLNPCALPLFGWVYAELFCQYTNPETAL